MRSTSKLRVFLLGGLGNQLFGAFFARAASLRLKEEVELSDQLIPFGSNPNRSLAIDQLSWAIGPKVSLKCKKLFGQNLLLRSSLLRRLIWHSFRLFGRRQRLNLQDFWQHKWEPSEKIAILDYFNDWFFAEYVRTNDSEFTKGLEINEKYPLIVNEKKVLVHVRIGDYLEHSEMYSLVSEAYYLKAIDLIKEKHNLKETSVIVICENAQEVRKYYPKLSSICTEIVDKKGLNSDIDAFNLLASSTHLIAGNSTFSFWAAWIGLTQRMTTIVPEDERLNENQSGLRELSWIVLDARTGKVKEKRPYVSWFKEKEDRFHATMASLNESLSN
jgi:hypothetical protein